eukprot:1180711-Prorocentrum_minimum.AAC.1
MSVPEVGGVRVGSHIGHGQQPLAVVLELEAFRVVLEHAPKHAVRPRSRLRIHAQTGEIAPKQVKSKSLPRGGKRFQTGDAAGNAGDERARAIAPHGAQSETRRNGTTG